MKLKHALWATAIWSFISLLGCGGIIGYIATHPIPGASQEKRAQMAGQGAATLVMIGFGLIWLPYAIAVGKKKRAARERDAEDRLEGPRRSKKRRRLEEE